MWAPQVAASCAARRRNQNAQPCTTSFVFLSTHTRAVVDIKRRAELNILQ